MPGRDKVAELIERNCDQAGFFASFLFGSGDEILNDVVLNQVLVSFGTAEMTQRVIQRIQEGGTCWCGTTVWQGRTAMRISVSSWATQQADVERSIAEIVKIAHE